jgi:hypothetical protein
MQRRFSSKETARAWSRARCNPTFTPWEINAKRDLYVLFKEYCAPSSPTDLTARAWSRAWSRA